MRPSFVSHLPSVSTLTLTPPLFRPLSFSSEPLLPQVKPSCLQPLELGGYLVPLEGDAVRLFGLRPEVRDGEALVEVGAEVDCGG